MAAYGEPDTDLRFICSRTFRRGRKIDNNTKRSNKTRDHDRCGCDHYRRLPALFDGDGGNGPCDGKRIQMILKKRPDQNSQCTGQQDQPDRQTGVRRGRHLYIQIEQKDRKIDKRGCRYPTEVYAKRSFGQPIVQRLIQRTKPQVYQEKRYKQGRNNDHAKSDAVVVPHIYPKTVQSIAKDVKRSHIAKAGKPRRGQLINTKDGQPQIDQAPDRKSVPGRRDQCRIKRGYLIRCDTADAARCGKPIENNGRYGGGKYENCTKTVGSCCWLGHIYGIVTGFGPVLLAKFTFSYDNYGNRKVL